MEALFHAANNYIHAGGPVMVPILLVSLVMWILILNRVFYIRRLFYKNMPRTVAGNLVEGNHMPDQTYRGANALLVREFLAHRSGDAMLDGYLLDEIVLRLVSSLNQYLSIITVLSSIAPLLGLLGTVTGMMATFDAITSFGTGNIKAMAGGISEALITTQTGLLISIPGLYMSGFLQKRANNLKHRIAATGMYLRRFI